MCILPIILGDQPYGGLDVTAEWDFIEGTISLQNMKSYNTTLSQW